MSGFNNPPPQTGTGTTLVAANAPTIVNPIINGHLITSGTAPGVTAGAQAGTTPPGPATIYADDSGGSITFGTGTTPAAGAQVVVAFNAAWGRAPAILISENNALTEALGLYVSAVNQAGFTVSSVNAPAASQANTVYAFSYAAIG